MKLKKILILSLIIGFTMSLSANVERNYRRYCKKCHDSDGSGQTKAGKKQDVRDYRDPSVLGQYTDEELFKFIKEGVYKDGEQTMEGYGDKLTDEEIHELVEYCKAFAKKEG